MYLLKIVLAVLTNYLLWSLDTLDRLFTTHFICIRINNLPALVTFTAVRKTEERHERKPDWLIFIISYTSVKLLSMDSCPIFSPIFTPALLFHLHLLFSYSTANNAYSDVFSYRPSFANTNAS